MRRLLLLLLLLAGARAPATYTGLSKSGGITIRATETEQGLYSLFVKGAVFGGGVRGEFDGRVVSGPLRAFLAQRRVSILSLKRPTPARADVLEARLALGAGGGVLAFPLLLLVGGRR